MLAAGLSIQVAAQGGMANPSAPAGKIGSSAVWQPPQDFLTKAHTACDTAAGPASTGECFANQMSVAGAPAPAVSFTRQLLQQNGGMFGIMSAFKNFGVVDAAQVFYPMRANSNYAVLLVNGDPNFLDVDDLEKLDRTAMEADPMFQSIKKQYPKVTLFNADRSGPTPWPRVQTLPDGGQQFIVTYPLLDGCHACSRLGLMRFGWNFDAHGKFLRTTFIPTPPPPKLLKRPHSPMQQPPAAQPQAQPQQ